ncbi:ribosome maturation factor RimM [Striga asiatica]|uniref:Ribosome maturation factor RimM n=1 Tax=Striga asiatica TaxID=4170 RepID=A0A5A7QT79_STRAF|nr:ribosome maturation factor RimM [Striga asiatica]
MWVNDSVQPLDEFLHGKVRDSRTFSRALQRMTPVTRRQIEHLLGWQHIAQSSTSVSVRFAANWPLRLEPSPPDSLQSRVGSDPPSDGELDDFVSLSDSDEEEIDTVVGIFVSEAAAVLDVVAEVSIGLSEDLEFRQTCLFFLAFAATVLRGKVKWSPLNALVGGAAQGFLNLRMGPSNWMDLCF